MVLESWVVVQALRREVALGLVVVVALLGEPEEESRSNDASNHDSCNGTTGNATDAGHGEHAAEEALAVVALAHAAKVERGSDVLNDAMCGTRRVNVASNGQIAIGDGRASDVDVDTSCAVSVTTFSLLTCVRRRTCLWSAGCDALAVCGVARYGEARGQSARGSGKGNAVDGRVRASGGQRACVDGAFEAVVAENVCCIAVSG